MKLTFQKLASQIAKREGKKSQARIGDIREILKTIVDLEVECAEREAKYEEHPVAFIIDAAAKRMKRKKRGSTKSKY